MNLHLYKYVDISVFNNFTLLCTFLFILHSIVAVRESGIAS